MAALCHFYGWTPDVVWNMSAADVAGFVDWRKKYIEAQNEG